MTTFFKSKYRDFNGNIGNFTHCSGPVIINSENKILLHISSSTKKYQFIGGRLDDSLSFRENAIERAKEVIGNNKITLLDDEPCVIIDEIERDGEIEKLILIHYKAILENESDIGEAEWKTLEEIEELAKKDMLSSPNILIANKYFLGK